MRKGRPGIRFDRGSVQGPIGGYLGGGDVEILSVTGSVEVSVGDEEHIPNNGPFGTFEETSRLNKTLRGETTSESPSWTNSHIRNSAFVVTALSSSNHEAQVLNAYYAGEEHVGPMSASVPVYLSKRASYRHVTVKKTASYEDLKPLPAGVEGGVPLFYDPLKGTDVTRVSGTVTIYYPPSGTWMTYHELSDEVGEVGDYFPSSRQIPAMIPIEVPYEGKIVDLKIWVELMQVSGSGGITHDSLNPGRYPLGNLMLSLRSPHVRGFHAHPIRNSPALKKIFTSNFQDFTFGNMFAEILLKGNFGPDYINPFYRDSFLLWEGAGPLGQFTNGPWDDNFYKTPREIFNAMYPSWERDRSMRTVFCDGSPVPNPRHLLPGGPSASFQGAPNSYFGFNNAWGFDVPWTSETEISGANTYQAPGSPPKGWLSGPGGTNLPDEWPTTGVNYGAETIRPVYPLLDPIYQRKRLSFPLTKVVATASALFNHDEWVGFRPGLRGTEASGTWYLMIADHKEGIPLGTFEGSPVPTYFRQVRLEFVLTSGSTPSVRNDYSDVSPRDSRGEIRLSTISGSDIVYSDDVDVVATGVLGTGTIHVDLLFHPTASWEAHLNDTYLVRDGIRSSVGRTFGITHLTGAFQSGDYALFYRLTGSLADVSGTFPHWLVAKGVPSIPVSSASLFEVEPTPVTTINPHDVLSPGTILETARRLQDAARDAGPPKTRVQLYQALLSGTAT